MLNRRSAINHRYTNVQDAYIVENYGEMTADQMAQHIGVSPKAIYNRVRDLKSCGRITPDRHPLRRENPYVDRRRITDGYPDVPYWMRQSYRPQDLALDMYKNYDEEASNWTPQEEEDE